MSIPTRSAALSAPLLLARFRVRDSSRDALAIRETRCVRILKFLAKLLGRKCVWQFGDSNADSLTYQQRQGQVIHRNVQRRPHVGLESRPSFVPRSPSQGGICGGENSCRHRTHASGSTLESRADNGPGEEHGGPDGVSAHRDHRQR